MSHLVRVFRAVAKPGQEGAFRSFLLGDGVKNVRAFDGLVSVRVGLPTEERPNDFLMITTWKSIDALAAFAGEAWQTAVVVPDEAPLLDEVHVDHYWEAEV